MKKCSVTNICVLFFISSTSIILYIFMHSKGQVSQVFDPSGNTLIQTSELAKDIWKSNGTKTKFLESKTVVTEKLDSQVLDDKARVLAAAKKITQNGGTLLVSFINNAYLPFAYSWLCNVQTMNLNKQILVIAADKETEESLKKKRPDIAAVSVSGFTMKGNQRYTRAGYVRIGIKRTQILNWILQENIGIFLFEFDCLWVRNPVPELTRFTEHDLIITPVAQRPGMVAIGFYYMAPTDRMKQLWQELTRRLMVLDKRLQKLAPGTVISEGDNDQLYLTALIRQKYANVRVKLLSLSEYPDGKWYELPENKRNISKIFILNNNWIEGNPAKISRAKKYGHWFLKDDGTCDDEQVNKIVKENGTK